MITVDPRPRWGIFGAYLALAGAVFALDQSTKWIVMQAIALNDAIPVVPGFFSISHVLNPGAAFSLFANAPSDYTRTGLIVFSCLVIVVSWLISVAAGQQFSCWGCRQGIGIMWR